MSKLDDAMGITMLEHAGYSVTADLRRKQAVKIMLFKLIDQAIPPIPTNLESKELIDYYDGVHYARERIRKEVEEL